MQKRILYVITKSNFGGAQRYVFELATAMQENGHEVAVASAPEGELVDRLQTAGITHFPIKSFQRDVNFAKEVRVMEELRHCFRTFKPEVVHLNSSKAGALGGLAARLAHVPMILFTVHGWPYLEPRNWLWRAAAYFGSFLTGHLAHQVIVVSQNDLAHAPRWLTKKCQVIPTAVPHIDFAPKEDARSELFSPEAIDAHRHDLWLVTIAELNHNKNLTTAIDAVTAFNQTAEQKVFYTIIGEGEQRPRLEARINKHGADGQIRLLGQVPNARMYLKAFDVFLLPSRKEGMPYAVLEAGAAGLPVIASKVGGIPEVIQDGVTGLLTDPLDATTITKALENLREESKRNQLGTALQEKINAEFTLPHMIISTEALYAQ